jgi:hypothetical protein
MSTELTRRSFIEGKTIKRVTLERGKTENGRKYSHLQQLEFTDGTTLVLAVVETGSDYAVIGRLYEGTTS